jgi:hypothetical protein
MASAGSGLKVAKQGAQPKTENTFNPKLKHIQHVHSTL